MAEIRQDNQRERREEALAVRLGIERFFYLRAIQAAVTFTTGAAADPSPLHWRQWGARNLGGRIRAFAQDPRNPARIYAGSAQGGVFRSEDDGETWKAIGTPADSFPVGAIAIAPSSPNIVYVGTGEPGIIHRPSPAPPAAPIAVLQREAFAAGFGLYRFDANTGLYTNDVVAALGAPGTAGAANSYAAIAVDPRVSDRCWVASHTGLWRREPTAPKFRREMIPSNPPPAVPNLGACVSDVILVENWDPSQSTTYRIYAAVAGWGIFRGVFNPKPNPTTTWDPILTGGLPVPGVPAAVPYDRIRIAACRSFPGHLYAVFENRGDHSIRSVFHTADGGDQWTPCSVPDNLGAQAWVNLCIGVHPDNPAIVVVGNVNVGRSLDFGVTWETILDDSNFNNGDRAQHADTHALVFDLREPNRLWVGNDGGVSSAADVANVNPLTARTWRKRSDGLCVSQFNDITSHPNYPFMLGGGLQDNSTYITFGGPTWLLAGDADGGQMCFEIANPRRYVAPNEGDANGAFNMMQSTVVAGSSVEPWPGFYPSIVRSPIADLAGTPNTPNDVFAVQLAQPNSVPAVGGVALGSLFVQNCLHHPRQANNLLIGCTGDVGFSTDGGLNYAAGGAPGIGAADVTALAFGPGDQMGSAPFVAGHPISDWWIGTATGQVLRGGGAIPKAWVAPPAPALAPLPPPLGTVTSIAVHPANAAYVLVATGGSLGPPAVTQGRVYLSLDQGAHWLDISGLGSPTSLPPCPITTLAFDPTVAAGGPQVAFAGTLAGVYVIRNLPPLAGPLGALVPAWRTFNGPAAAPLPLTLVNDLEVVQLPPRPGAAAGSPESAQRVRLYAAMYGRGIFVCDLTRYAAPIPAGGPQTRLVIRQHLVEDGLSYPRSLPADLNAPIVAPSYNLPQMQGDPRLTPIPAPGPPPVPAGRFDNHSAFDIRVDNEPFQFFDQVLDGVEFDEELRTKHLVAGQVNAVYVQVHNAGWGAFAQAVDVHLFFAQGAAPGAVADPPPLPDLHDNFWANFTVEPELPAPGVAPVPPAARWQRVGKKQIVPANQLRAIDPAVVRFEWTPPVSLAAGFAGLLAVCTNPEDALPPPAGMPTQMLTLIRQERRAAFRLVAVDAYTPDVFIRDDVEDTGRTASGSFAGRSPDIIVVQSAEPTPGTAFGDLLDTHDGDRIRPTVPQIIYIRVFNRRNVQVQARVDVFWTRPNAPTSATDTHAPAFDGTKWAAVTPVGTANVAVPAAGWAIANLTWQAADVPPPDPGAGAFNAIGFAALASSTEGLTDPAPPVTGVFDSASFWDFFGRTAQSNNAAFRAVRYGDGG